MATYFTPGVYVEEIAKLPASVVPVATAIPCFIGYTELHDANVALAPVGSGTPTEATRITSLVEYEAIFGGPHGRVGVTLTSTPTPISTTSIAVTVDAGSTQHLMYYALQMFFANGGGACYIISVDEYPTSSPYVDHQQLIYALEAATLVDEPTLLVFPDLINVHGASASVRETNFYAVYQQALAHCATLQDRFLIMDTYYDSTYTSPAADSASALRDEIGTQYLSYGAAYIPYLQTSLPYLYGDDEVTFNDTANHLQVENRTLAYILNEMETNANGGKAFLDSRFNAEVLQFIRDEIEDATGNMILGPSAAMAGVYAATDRNRGVWKAPANVSLAAVTGPQYKITDAIQADLNVHSTGKSINAIRPFTGKGTLVWGARTLDGNSNEWRYVPVRRLFIFVEESIKEATEFVVFEPNDANTWARVRAMISNFLFSLWRDGALAGAKPEHAFFVNVGLGQTMTPDDILNGRLIIEIGMAAVRPAEFIILRFMHKLQES